MKPRARRVYLTKIPYYDFCMERKIQGHEVTEAQINEWVAEAEAGYDAVMLKKRGRGRPGRGARPSQVIAVRFTDEELAVLDERAERLHVTRSQLIREAVLA